MVPDRSSTAKGTEIFNKINVNLRNFTKSNKEIKSKERKVFKWNPLEE